MALVFFRSFSVSILVGVALLSYCPRRPSFVGDLAMLLGRLVGLALLSSCLPSCLLSDCFASLELLLLSPYFFIRGLGERRTGGSLLVPFCAGTLSDVGVSSLGGAFVSIGASSLPFSAAVLVFDGLAPGLAGSSGSLISSVRLDSSSDSTSFLFFRSSVI